MKSTILASILVLMLSACAPATSPTAVTPTADSTVSASTENPLANTQWTLTTFSETGAERPVVEGSVVTLEFEEGGRAGGAGGCNSYGGTYQVEDGTLSFDQITSTLMACVDERVMQQEDAYFAALQTAGEFEITDDRLAIWYDDGRGVLNFNRGIAVPPTPAGVTPAPPEVPSTPGGDTPTAIGGYADPTATPSDPAWTRQQFGDAWDVAYPAGWTVNAAGAYEGAVQLQGQYGTHTYQINLSYPIGITAQSLEAWVEAQLASLTPEQRAAVEVSDDTVANAPAQKVLNLPAAGGASPMHHVYIWRTDNQNPRLITIAQVDEQAFDAAAMEALLDRFIAEVRGE